jgi:hypothetical protein
MKQILALILAISIFAIENSYSQDLHGNLKVFSYIKGCHGTCNYSYADYSDINDCGSEKDSIIEVINIFKINGAYYANGKLLTQHRANLLLDIIETNKIRIGELLKNIATENNAEFIPPMASCFQFEEYQFYIDKALISYIVLDGDKNGNGSLLKSEDVKIFDQLKTMLK